jgi:hypothetical protein
MANPTITTNYAGMTTGEVLQLLVLGNEAFQKNSFMFYEDIDDKGLELSRLVVGQNLIQPYAAMPTTPSNAMTFSPRRLDPVEVMLYDVFNPKEFRSYWKEFQKEGPLADKDIDPSIKNAITANYASRVNNQLGRLIWSGDKSTGAELRYIDGIVTRALADASVLKPATNGNNTAANIIANLTSLHNLVSDALYSDPDGAIHMSTRDYRFYQDALIALANKGPAANTFAAGTTDTFKGMTIKHYSTFPNNFILFAKGTNSPNSNLVSGMNAASDVDNIKIERWRPEGETYFIKANFSLDVNYGFSEELFIYKPA